MQHDIAAGAATASATCELRRRVMELGTGLGWRRDEVVAFTESLTGHAWGACGDAELEAVCREYEAIQREIAAKRLRRRALAEAILAQGHRGQEP